jgi:N utilization substance protein A
MASTQEDEGYKSLMKIPGVGEKMAEKLFREGLKSVATVAAADPAMLSALPGVGERTAAVWIEEAAKIIDEELSGKKEA